MHASPQFFSQLLDAEVALSKKSPESQTGLIQLYLKSIDLICCCVQSF